MDDDNDDEEVMVMVVDSVAHNFQISNVKPRLYALFVEKEERLLANVSSQTPTLVWRSHEYNLTQPPPSS